MKFGDFDMVTLMPIEKNEGIDCIELEDYPDFCRISLKSESHSCSWPFPLHSVLIINETPV